jgi:hypothetical protein
MSFHIRGINFICFYIRLYIILLSWTFSKLFARFSFLFLKFISVNSSTFVSEDLNFKSLHFSQNSKFFLVAFSISLPIFDPGMSFSVNYIDKNNRLISLNTSHCVQDVLRIYVHLCTSLHDHWACVLLFTAWLGPFWWLDWWIWETKMKNYTF